MSSNHRYNRYSWCMILRTCPIASMNIITNQLSPCQLILILIQTTKLARPSFATRVSAIMHGFIKKVPFKDKPRSHVPLWYVNKQICKNTLHYRSFSVLQEKVTIYFLGDLTACIWFCWFCPLYYNKIIRTL